MAQFRVGYYNEALTTLLRCNELNDGTQPADVAFIAMSQHALGKVDEARATLERLRELMKQAQWEANDEARVIFREAVELIHGVEEPTSKPSQEK